MLVQVDLSRILIREMTDTQFITLTECDGERSFPIAIGLPEAFAIERRMRRIEVPRPQTHDLLADVVRQLDGTLDRIVIHSLQDGTFFASLMIEKDGEEIEVDCRPSDAIALGVAEAVPMFVAEDVLAEASKDVDDAAGEMPEDSGWNPEFGDDDEDDDETWL
jgi:bifunctional DNase/RNase